MNYSSLGKYYDDIFQMKMEHNFSISELMDLLPFERDIFINMINVNKAQKADLDRLTEMQLRNVKNVR